MSWLRTPRFWLLAFLLAWLVLVTVLIALGEGHAPAGAGPR